MSIIIKLPQAFVHEINAEKKHEMNYPQLFALFMAYTVICVQGNSFEQCSAHEALCAGVNEECIDMDQSKICPSKIYRSFHKKGAPGLTRDIFTRGSFAL